jgi:hypothetical protein
MNIIDSIVRLIQKYAPRYVRYASVAFASAFTLMFAAIAVWHLRYPYEIEWYEGLMMDHVMRVVHGLPIYAQPNIYFTATLYQPLYFYLVAPLVSVIGPSFLAGRIVTIACTLLTAFLIALIVKRLTHRSRFAILTALGLFFATYALTDYVQTLVRTDAPYVFFVLLSVFVLSRKTWFSSIFGGLIFAAAYFVKQEALFFMPLPLLWLLLNDKRKFGVAVGVLAVALAIGTYFWQTSSHGWYSYYVYAMPGAKSKYFGYFRVLAALPAEVFRYWGVGLLLIGVMVVSIRGRKFEVRGEEGLWAAMLLAAIGQFCMHRGDQMAGNNVLHPLATMMAIYIPYAVWRGRMEASAKIRPALAGFFEWGLLIQLASFVYIPTHLPMLFPGASERARANNFIAYLRSIPGDVVIPAHGFLGTLAGKRTHTHVQVEDDVLVMHDSVSRAYQVAWQQAFREQKFGAIIWDESPAHQPDSVPGYSLVHSLPDSLRVGAKMGDVIVRPTFLYLPKPARVTNAEEGQ